MGGRASLAHTRYVFTYGINHNYTSGGDGINYVAAVSGLLRVRPGDEERLCAIAVYASRFLVSMAPTRLPAKSSRIFLWFVLTDV